jgi:P-type Mg2+ transporter
MHWLGPTPLAGTGSWTQPLNLVLAELGATSADLTQAEAERRLARCGANDALSRRRRPLWKQVVDRFINPLILILLFAGGLSAWTGQVMSFVIIAVIILLSVVLDIVQQLRAENAVEALRKSVALRTSAVREGQGRHIAVEEVVPGGLVRLAAGDIVPADCRLVGARDLFVNQALLTGEAYPVEKQVGGLAVTVADISGATNYLFMGTSIISGTATAVACRTGRTTVLGELAGSLVAQRPQDAFEHGIRRFGLPMLRFTTFLVLFVLAANVLF